jgi:hypothetical protein
MMLSIKMDLVDQEKEKEKEKIAEKGHEQKKVHSLVLPSQLYQAAFFSFLGASLILGSISQRVWISARMCVRLQFVTVCVFVPLLPCNRKKRQASD